MEIEQILFDNWTVLLRTALMAVLGYASLIVILRIMGKRSLAKMNAFDWIVTVALGSTLATITLNKDVTLAQGALALLMLVGLQFLLTWSSVRAPWVRHLVTGEPALLLYKGEPLADALRRERVANEELQAAVRAAGLAQLSDAYAVVLETDGSFSVIPSPDGAVPSSLTGIKTPGDGREAAG